MVVLEKHLFQTAVTTPPDGHFQQGPVFDVERTCAFRLYTRFITYLAVSGKEESMKFIDEIDLKDKKYT
jgi:hypothetical protein